MGTFLGICAAVALLVGLELEAPLTLPNTFFEVFFVVSLFFSSLPWVWTLILSLGAETNPISAKALRSNMQDRLMYLYSCGVIIASFAGIIIMSYQPIPVVWCFGISVILAGIILDLLRLAYFRLQYRRSPEGIADWFVERMKVAVRRHDERLHALSFEMVFTLIAGYIKCGELGGLRIFCQKIVAASDLWLGAMAKLSLFRIPSETEETLLDRYSLAEAMTAKRLAWIIKEACEEGSPTALEEIVRFAGKLFLSFHGYHPLLGFVILVTLSQVNQKVDGKIDRWDRDAEINAVFSEIVKSLIDKVLERRIPDTESIAKVLAILETHVKESFRREKMVNPAFLMQPFAEIGQMLAAPRYEALPDREEIIANLRRILAQFAALETVTGRIEIQGEGTDTASTFHEDLPFTRPPKMPRE